MFIQIRSDIKNCEEKKGHIQPDPLFLMSYYEEFRLTIDVEEKSVSLYNHCRDHVHDD